jgi:hypothetical protein
MSHGEVIIETGEPVTNREMDELRKLPEVAVQSQKDRILTLSTGKGADVSAIVSFLTSRGVRIEQVKKQEATLEEIYTTILKEAEQN